MNNISPLSNAHFLIIINRKYYYFWWEFGDINPVQPNPASKLSGIFQLTLKLMRKDQK